jgi:glycine oxidase
MGAPFTIVGQGIAGTCLAWRFWRRGVPFRIMDRGKDGASRVAAGLINPLSGRNFEPGPQVAEFLGEALSFYRTLEHELGGKFWHPMPILRYADHPEMLGKMRRKSLRNDVACWLESAHDHAQQGGAAAFTILGGGRLDIAGLISASAAFFAERGLWRLGEHSGESGEEALVFCDGAAGLMSGRHGPHRCAKGEILTLRAPSFDASRIRIGGGGWLVPAGDGLFRAGATYGWDPLDDLPTEQGRETLLGIARTLGLGEEFEVLRHEAGIRPILRRSDPFIGPCGTRSWMFNGLGSKGALHAPGMARRLERWIVEGITPEVRFRIDAFLGDS